MPKTQINQYYLLMTFVQCKNLWQEINGKSFTKIKIGTRTFFSTFKSSNFMTPWLKGRAGEIQIGLLNIFGSHVKI